jgi:hypothetical protein
MNVIELFETGDEVELDDGPPTNYQYKNIEKDRDALDNYVKLTKVIIYELKRRKLNQNASRIDFIKNDDLKLINDILTTVSVFLIKNYPSGLFLYDDKCCIYHRLKTMLKNTEMEIADTMTDKTFVDQSYFYYYLSGSDNIDWVKHHIYKYYAYNTLYDIGMYRNLLGLQHFQDGTNAKEFSKQTIASNTDDTKFHSDEFADIICNNTLDNVYTTSIKDNANYYMFSFQDEFIRYYKSNISDTQIQKYNEDKSNQLKTFFVKYCGFDIYNITISTVLDINTSLRFTELFYFCWKNMDNLLCMNYILFILIRIFINTNKINIVSVMEKYNNKNYIYDVLKHMFPNMSPVNLETIDYINHFIYTLIGVYISNENKMEYISNISFYTYEEYITYVNAFIDEESILITEIDDVTNVVATDKNSVNNFIKDVTKILEEHDKMKVIMDGITNAVKYANSIKDKINTSVDHPLGVTQALKDAAMVDDVSDITAYIDKLRSDAEKKKSDGGAIDELVKKCDDVSREKKIIVESNELKITNIKEKMIITMKAYRESVTQSGAQSGAQPVAQTVDQPGSDEDLNTRKTTIEQYTDGDLKNSIKAGLANEASAWASHKRATITMGAIRVNSVDQEKINQANEIFEKVNEQALQARSRVLEAMKSYNVIFDTNSSDADVQPARDVVNNLIQNTQQNKDDAEAAEQELVVLNNGIAA